MPPDTSRPALIEIDAQVRAFESAWAGGHTADVRKFLPPTSHPHFRAVATELLRVDLEMRYARGRPPVLGDYRRAYPEVFDGGDAWSQLVFEEYRQKIERGEPCSPQDYAERFGLDTREWPPPADRPGRAGHG